MQITQQDLESTRKKVLEITRKIRNKEDDAPKLSEKGMKVQAILNAGGFSSLDVGLAALMSVVLGEEIILNKKSYWDKRGVVVVPIDNPNSHSYPLQLPALLIGHQAYAIDLNGQIGNRLPANLNRDIRIATDIEVEFYFDQLINIIKQNPVHSFNEHMPIYLSKDNKKTRNER